MIQTLSRNWWLLASCGILCAIFSAVCMLTLQPDGSLALRNHALQSTLTLLGELALAAGACSIAASLWKSATGKSWLLALNGATLIALGLLFNGAFGAAVSFRSIANLYAILAISIAGFEWTAARILRGQTLDKWFLAAAGVVSIAYAVTFLLIQPAPPSDFIWFGSYFGFTAVCMLAMAARLHWAHFPPLTSQPSALH